MDKAWTRGRGSYSYAWHPAAFDPQAGSLSGRGAHDVWQLVVTTKGGGSPEAVPALPDNCPACGYESRRDRDQDFEDAGWSNVVTRSMGTGYERITQVLVGALHRALDTSSVVFSDSRQDAARVNAGIELAHYLDTVRQVVVASMERKDEYALALSSLIGLDQSPEAAAAAAKVATGEERMAALRLATGGGSPEDEALVRAKLGSQDEVDLAKLANRVVPELLELGMNPAGIKVEAQRTRNREPWTRIWSWNDAGVTPRADHELTQSWSSPREDPCRRLCAGGSGGVRRSGAGS